ncbi:MAG: VCBS repeat-containing protein [Planctomycetota bacterium]|nr:VCBS repeat-containing protein [Planctomycetota bacterium]
MKPISPSLFCKLLLILATVIPGCRKDPQAPGQSGKSKNQSASPAENPPFQFTDRTAKSGISGTCRTGGESELRTMLETLGGGVGITDFDLDGQLDCFFNGGGLISREKNISGQPSYLYRNLGNFRFEDSASVGNLDTRSLYNHGCQLGDLDNDGFGDLVVTGYQGILVFRNMGDGSFEAIECGIQTDKWATSAALADFDGDGNLDLFVANYLDWSFENHKQCGGKNKKDVCSPRAFNGLVDDLFTSQADWTFVRDGNRKGIRSKGKSLGVVAGDIDVDGDVDIYVACDVTNNLLYLNQGDGTFLEQGAITGVDVGDGSMPNGSMGTDLGDFNRDGLPDLGVANFASEDFALYKQTRVQDGDAGSFFFNFASKKTRLTATDQMYVGWGTLFSDFDLDGDEDLLVNNGHISYFPDTGEMAQQPLIFENRGETYAFRNVVKSDYFTSGHHGRGVAAADFDRDGDLDLAFSNCNENFAILENGSAPKQPVMQCLLIRTNANRDGIGWNFRFEDRIPVLLRKGGGSFLSSLCPEISLPLHGQEFDPEKIGLAPIPQADGTEISFEFVSDGTRLIGVERPAGKN